MSAAADADSERKKQLRCVANYFVGMAYLLGLGVVVDDEEPDTAKAAEYFRACLDTGLTNYFEYELAALELRRLGIGERSQ